MVEPHLDDDMPLRSQANHKNSLRSQAGKVQTADLSQEEASGPSIADLQMQLSASIATGGVGLEHYGLRSGHRKSTH